MERPPRRHHASRRTLRLILTLHGLIALVDVAEPLAAELVSNAVRHTKGPAAPRVRWSPPGTLRIGAWDADPEPPERVAARRAGEVWRWCGLHRHVGVAATEQRRQPGKVRVV